MTNESGVFRTSSCRTYQFSNVVEPKNVSASAYTPSVTYYRQERPKPKILKATLMNIRNRPVAVKYLEPGKNPAMLKNEQRALQRLAWLANLPGLKIAPRLYEPLAKVKDLPVNEGGKALSAYCIVYEWIEDHSDKMRWENLSEWLRDHKPLADEEIKQLHAALARAVRWMHRMNVFHGDLKNEHILIVVRNEKPDFSQIRLIDFGLSYLGNTADWRGASVGFCPPFFWNPANRKGRRVNELRWLDWYAVDAILYYAGTGQCFPAASPAYRDLAESTDFYNALKQTLTKVHKDSYLKQIIQRLCNYAYETPAMSVYQPPKIAAGDSQTAINGVLLAMFTIGILMQWFSPFMLVLLPLFLFLWMKFQSDVSKINPDLLPIFASALAILAHFLHGIKPALQPFFFVTPVLFGLLSFIAWQFKQKTLLALLSFATIAPIVTHPVMAIALPLLAGYQFSKLEITSVRWLWGIPVIGGVMAFFSSSAMPEHFLHRFPAPVHNSLIALVVNIVSWLILFAWANWMMRKSKNMPNLNNFWVLWGGGLVLFLLLPFVFGAILQIRMILNQSFILNVGLSAFLLITLANFLWNYEEDTPYDEEYN